MAARRAHGAHVRAPAGVLLTRWTIQRRYLKARVSLQMVIFGAWTLGIIPYAAERVRPSGGAPAWWALPLLAPFGAIAASAVQEFVRRGNGTPLPYDPPQRLVTSGAYAYVTNPMQLSMTVVLLGLAAIMRNPFLAAAALLATAYGSGLAAWHESVTTAKRFGERWTAYRAHMHASIRGCVRMSRTSRSYTSPVRVTSALVSVAGSRGDVGSVCASKPRNRWLIRRAG